MAANSGLGRADVALDAVLEDEPLRVAVLGQQCYACCRVPRGLAAAYGQGHRRRGPVRDDILDAGCDLADPGVDLRGLVG